MEGKQSGQSENTIQHEICQDPLFTRKPYTSIKNNMDVVLHVCSNKHIIGCPSVNTSDKSNGDIQWPSQNFQDEENEKIRCEFQDAVHVCSDINMHNKKVGVKMLILIKILSLINPTLYLIGSKQWNTLLRLALSGRLPSKVITDSLFNKARTALNIAVRRKEIQAILRKLRHHVFDPLSAEGSEALQLQQQLWKLLYEELNESEYDEVFTLPLHEDSGASVFYQPASMVPGLKFTLTSTYFNQSWSTVRGVFSKRAVSKLIQTHRCPPMKYATHLQDLPKAIIATTDASSNTDIDTTSSHNKPHFQSIIYPFTEPMPSKVEAPQFLEKRIRNDQSTKTHHPRHIEAVDRNDEQQNSIAQLDRQSDFHSESLDSGQRVCNENYQNNNYPSLHVSPLSAVNSQPLLLHPSSDSIVSSQPPSTSPSFLETLTGREETQQTCSHHSAQPVPLDHPPLSQSNTHTDTCTSSYLAPTHSNNRLSIHTTDGTCSSDISEGDNPFTSAVEETQPAVLSGVLVPNAYSCYMLTLARKNNVATVSHNLDSPDTLFSLTKTSLKGLKRQNFGCNIHKWLENVQPYECPKPPLDTFIDIVSDHNSPTLSRQNSKSSSHSSESSHLQPPPSLSTPDSGVLSTSPVASSSYSSNSETSVGREETQQPIYNARPVCQTLGRLLPPPQHSSNAQPVFQTLDRPLSPPQHSHIDYSPSPEVTGHNGRPPFLTMYGTRPSDVTEHSLED